MMSKFVKIKLWWLICLRLSEIVYATNCCSVIKSANTKDDGVIYKFTGTYHRERPFFVNDAVNRAIWFENIDDNPDWVVGDKDNIVNGQEIYGFLRSDEDTPCPTDTSDWRDVRNGEWLNNPDAKLECGLELYSDSSCTADSPTILTPRIMALYWDSVQDFLLSYDSGTYIKLSDGWALDRVNDYLYHFLPQASKVPSICYKEPVTNARYGIYEMLNYGNNENWDQTIATPCQNVQIYSSVFSTETNRDKLTIDGQVYSGKQVIDQLIISSKIELHFESDYSGDSSTNQYGFVLKWMCYVSPSECPIKWSLLHTSSYWYLHPNTASSDAVCIPKESLSENCQSAAYTHQCSGGYHACRGNYQCYNCMPGTYQNEIGTTECKQCSAGSYCPANSQIETPCEVGYYCADERLSSGNLCNPGTYQNAVGSTYCENCIIGHYCKKGSSNPTPCDTGHFCNDTQMELPIPCPNGTYQNQAGMESCITCPTGSYCPENSSNFIPCIKGTYQNSTGSSHCKSCPTGSYCESRSTTATLCPAGSHQNNTGMSECNTCPAGHYCEEGCINPIICEPGHECPSGRDSEKTCSGGSYQPNRGASVCLDCPEGYYCPIGSTKTIECEIGKFCQGLSEVSIHCSPGTYSNGTSAARCLECPAYHMCPKEGMGDPIICPDGNYTFDDISAGQIICRVCELGHYCKHGKSRACSSGYFSDHDGASECMPCELGTFQRNKQSSQCTKCPKAHFCPNLAMVQPVICPPKTYQVEQGMDVCNECVAGHYCIHGTISECGLGEFAPSNASSCTECSIGSFGNTTGMSACHICPHGTYQDRVGQTDCNPCEPGYYCVNGYREECRAGTFSTNYLSMECTLCDVGSYAADSGGIECTTCPEGFYCPKTGIIEPYQCNPGAYNNLTGQATCRLCPIGYSCRKRGKTQPIPCDVGFYQNNVAQMRCKQCGRGYFCPTTAGAEKIICPLGEYGSNATSSKCSICPNGYYTTTTGSTSLSDCKSSPYGYYSFEGSPRQCHFQNICHAGSFSPLPFTDSRISSNCHRNVHNQIQNRKRLLYDEQKLTNINSDSVESDCRFYCYFDDDCIGYSTFDKGSDSICARIIFIT